MPFGLPVAIVMLAQTASGAAAYGPTPPAPPPKPPAVKTAATADPCLAAKTNADTRVILICGQKPQGYRLNPDVMEAKREIRSAGRPTRPGPGAYHDNSRCVVGPEGCATAGINLIGVALTAAEMASRLAKGKEIGRIKPGSVNFAVWWDGDDLRELLDKNHIDKWNWNTQKTERLVTADGCTSCNGTKATPSLSGDILGDWREEVIWPTNDGNELRIYTTTVPTKRRLFTLMEDPQYRLAIVWQNVAYNQPPHPSFFIGEGMKDPPKPKITIIKPKEATKAR